MAEAKELAAGGAREIVLTGINLGLYQPDLSRVACHLSKIKNLARIRLSSIEPMYLTRELIDSLTKTPKVCHHLHLPIQSGDNNILKAMGREYSVDDLYRLADQIRTRWPDCGLTTDIIVGFPGEDEQEFQNTVSAIKKINFSRLHVFPYSQRPGTPAAGWPDQVEPRAKNARVKEIRELNRQLMFSFARQYQDKAVEVLVEQPGTGLTSNYIRCSFAETGNSSGQLRRFKVKSILANGELKLDSRK
jgi:threonylcarbamoyladenosine tRNA methylthiotransferase MtaB